MLVSRRYELGALRELFARCHAGRGGVALVTGGVACGKSALLQAFADEVAAAGEAVVLTAAGARAEQAAPMGVVTQLLQAAGRAVPLAERGAAGVCAALLELAQRQPVLVVVDDLQFADPASVDALRRLRHRMRSARLMLVLVWWDRPSAACSPALAELTRQPDRRILVGPFSPAGVAELVAARLGAKPGLAKTVHAAGGGNPFLTDALLDDLARRAGTGGAAPVSFRTRAFVHGQERPAAVSGPAFRSAVLDCLRRWDPTFAYVAGGVAVLGERAAPELVADLLGLPVHAVTQALDGLSAGGVVPADRPPHPELAAAVLTGLAPAERARLHARAAELLVRDGAGAVEIAHHLAAAYPAGPPLSSPAGPVAATAAKVPPPWAAGVLRQAAAQSTGEAVRYLELAMRACEDEYERATLHTAPWRDDLAGVHRALGLPAGEQLVAAPPAHAGPLAAMASPAAPVPLSEAEHKVAALAATGHSNREIGRKLYITVSTVEQHLTRVYKKLNVNGRTDLPSEPRLVAP